MFDVVMLERAVMGLMKMNDNGQDFAESSRLLGGGVWCPRRVASAPIGEKLLTEIIDVTEKFE